MHIYIAWLQVIDSIHMIAYTHPGPCVYPLVAALRGGIQEDGDVREGQVLQRAPSPVQVLLITCT